jgi:hypothetical protein
MSRRSASIAAALAAPLVGCGLFVDTSEYTFDGGSGAGGASTSATTAVGQGGGLVLAGAGGAMVSGGAGGSMGEGGEGGSACVPQCNGVPCVDDGCGNPCPCSNGGTCSSAGECCPATWAISLPKSAYRLTLDSPSQALYVADDGGTVRRLRTCDGGASPANAASLGSGFAPRVLEKVGGELYVAGQVTGSVRVHRFDAATLAPIGSPVTLPSPFASPGNVVRLGELGADGALWISALTDGGGFGRFVPGQSPCYQDAFSIADHETRGLAKIGADIVFGVTPFNGTSTNFRLISPLSSAMGPCTAAAGPANYPATTSVPLDMMGMGDEILFAASNGPLAAITRGVLGRSAPGGPMIERIYDPTPKIDAFTAVTHQGGVVYTGGGMNGTIDMNGVVSGELRLLMFPSNFEANTAPIAEVVVDGAQIPWKMTVDADGLYVAGQATSSLAGFVMKCTLALGCPVVPPP